MAPASKLGSNSSNAAIEDAIKSLSKTKISSGKSGKENCLGKDAVATAQRCLKSAQVQLAKPGQDVQQLASLCQASLRIMDQDVGSAGSSQTQTAAYKTIRLLVSAKAFGPAMEEALRLHEQLKKQHQSHKNSSSLSPDAVNLAVGTLLTLTLCWAEGAAATNAQLTSILQAAENCEDLFRFLPPQDAVKHSQTLFKSLYRGAARLVEAKQWEGLQATCCSMVVSGKAALAGHSMQAVTKFAAHVPDLHAISLLSATIRTPLVRSSLTQALDTKGASSPGSSEAHTLLSAAVAPASALRKVAARLAAAHSTPEALLAAFGGSEAAIATASSLESVAILIASGFRVAEGDCGEAFSGQGHTAAVAVATAVKLRAACCRLGDTSSTLDISSTSIGEVLGWEWPRWNSTPCVVSCSELSWLSSSLHNIGVELLSHNLYTPAATAFRGGLCAALSLLDQNTQTMQHEKDVSTISGSSIEVALNEVTRRTVALTESLKKGGNGADAAKAAEDSLALVLHLCPHTPATQLPEIVASAVDLRCQAKVPCSQPASKTSRRPAKATSSKARKEGASAVSSPPCLTATLEKHEMSLHRQTLALVARAELVACASLARSAGLPERKEQAQQWGVAAASYVLETLHPADTAPLDHCRTLLLLHSLKLSPSGEEEVLARAESILEVARDSDGAGTLRVLVSATQLLDNAQALVDEAVEEQQRVRIVAQEKIKRNPSEVHAEQSISGESSDNDVSSAAAWEDLLLEAENLSKQLEQSVDADERGEECDIAALAAIIDEVATMLGLHGRSDLEEKMLAALETISGGGGLQEASCMPVATIFESCVLPCIPEDADVGVLEAAYEELAAIGDRSTSVLLRRAELATSAALCHADAGEMVPALHWAGEAHRVLAPAAQLDTEAGTATKDGVDSKGVGWWRLIAAHCRSLLLLARLFEGAGMADEATNAVKEGLRMANATGTKLLTATFSLLEAEIAQNSGQCDAASVSLGCAERSLDAAPEFAQASSVAHYCSAQAASLQAKIHLDTGALTDALLCCHNAMEACQEVGNDHNPFVAAVAASAQLTRARILSAEGRGLPEVAEAAANALDNALTGALGAAERVQLSLLCAEASLPRSGDKFIPRARVWLPGLFTEELSSIPTSSSTKPRSSKSTKALPSNTDAGEWVATASLWAALQNGRACPHLQRLAALRLAPACAAAGHLHLAAVLLHISMGATMQMQHRLVLYSRAQQAQRRQRRGLEDSSAVGVEDAAAMLDGCLDWDIVAQLADQGEVKRGKKRISTPVNLLEALNTVAAGTLDRWLGAFSNSESTVCSISVLDGAAGKSNIIVSRLQPGAFPLMVELPVKSFTDGGGLFDRHPIRALNLEPEGGGRGPGINKVPSGAVASAAEEMRRVLERSGRSMKELATETKEQQREWWRVRVELDDAVAGLVQHLGVEWLGPWKCLLVGPPEEKTAIQDHISAVSTIIEHLEEALGGDGKEGEQGAAVVEQLVGAVLSGKDAMSPAELQAAAALVCDTLGVDASSSNISKVVSAISELRPSSAPPPPQDDTTGAPANTQRRVKFQTSPVVAGGGKIQDDAASPTSSLRPAFGSSAIESPRLAVAPHDLCGAFDSMALAGIGGGARTPAPGGRTIRAKKHRSRMGLMQAAATPGPRTARKPPATTIDDNVAAPSTIKRAAATAPRARRPLPTPAAARTVPAPARPSSRSPTTGPSGAPIILVLDPTLQSLPWESAPGLASQRLYRLPSLPCAAAARATPLAPLPTIDPTDAYYSLNPSGDLTDTQAAFEDWFKGLSGWEGRAGNPPPAAELATALQTKGLFVYCGHGGGEQYLPAARLRALPRCAPALLMGCSSGRLKERTTGYYEPSGTVLAYLLAGCPAAVANLWDVTDKDIDRYCQAVLMQWLSGTASTGRESGRGDVAAAVASARTACKLPFLIGAAPVVYGVPTLLV